MLTEKGFAGLLGRIVRAEGTMRSLVQEAIEDALAYAIDRQEQGHGLDLRRLSALQVSTIKMKSINSQRLSDYIKASMVDINGKSSIGWNQKDSAYQLLKKGTVVSVPSFDTRGNWFDFGKESAPKDDFDFSKRLNSLLTLAEKHADKLSEDDKALIAVLRANRTTIRMQSEAAVKEQAQAAAEAGTI